MRKLASIRLWFLALTTLVASSCNGLSPPKTDSATSEVSDEQLSQAFFNVVYTAIATRADSNWPWTPISGTYEMKFNDSTGKFDLYFSSYSEPQLCVTGTACSCTGTAQGSYTTSSSYVGNPPSESSTGSVDESTGGYDPNTPYTPPWSSGSSGGALTGDTSKVATFIFSLTYDTSKTSLFGCRSQSDRSVRVSRFLNGELNVEDGYRQVWLKPALK